MVVRLRYTGELRAPGKDTVDSTPVVDTPRLKSSTSSIPSIQQMLAAAVSPVAHVIL